MAAAHASRHGGSGDFGSRDRGAARSRVVALVGIGGALGLAIGAIVGEVGGAATGTLLGVVVGAGVGVAARRRTPAGPTRRSVDAFTINDPWRLLLLSAQRSERRFDQITAAMEDGPIRDYLARTGRQLADAVADIATIAVAGNRLDASIRSLNPTRLRSQLSREAELQHAASADAEPDEHRAVSISSLESQLATVDRLAAQSASTEGELRSRVTQLGELVASATEVSAGALPQSSFDSDVSSLVGSLQSLRQASEELPHS